MLKQGYTKIGRSLSIDEHISDDEALAAASSTLKCGDFGLMIVCTCKIIGSDKDMSAIGWKFFMDDLLAAVDRLPKEYDEDAVWEALMKAAWELVRSGSSADRQKAIRFQSELLCVLESLSDDDGDEPTCRRRRARGDEGEPCCSGRSTGRRHHGGEARA